MKTRNVKISLETATRWFKGTDNELKELAVQTYPEIAKKQLPKSWEELEKVRGYFIEGGESKISYADLYSTLENQNIFATGNQAKSALAMAKLSQVMAVYNDGWVANWSDGMQDKWCIVSYLGKQTIEKQTSYKEFLTLKTEELAQEFLTNFKEDIETYFNY